MNILAKVLVSLSWTVSLSSASIAQAGMDCKDATVVTYQKGPNWSQFPKHRDAHVAVIEKYLANGTLLLAGPTFTGDDMDGGLSIYAETDLAKVKPFVGEDALVVNNVAVPVIKSWAMCTKK